MQKAKIVVTNRCFPETLALLGPHADVTINHNIEPWPYDEVLGRCAEADAVMAFMTDKIDADFIAACPNLRVIGAALKGFDNIDVEAATHAGIWVTIVPDLLTAPTAELAIGLLLSVSRKISQADAQIRADGFKGWRPTLYGRGLAGETVGIVGFGCVGQAIAERLSGFSCNILAYDINPAANPPSEISSLRMTDLSEVVTRSAYVILALPLLPSTQGLFDEKLISRMPRGSFLINPARGSLVDEAAVADAIASGQLAGYAADVFECEDWARGDRPRDIHPLLRADTERTVLTPHLGSAVESVRREIELSAAESILQVLSGNVPEFAINQPATSHI
jgi:phosphonate dehydrogenase